MKLNEFLELIESVIKTGNDNFKNLKYNEAIEMYELVNIFFNH
jgi:hypothetical protein